MIYKTIDHLDLVQTAESGQTFRWIKEEKGYIIPAFSKELYIEQNGDRFLLSCTEAEWESTWLEYFDIATDYGHVEDVIEKCGDAHLKACRKKGNGIRILRQDPWEMIVTFMISQNNNIPRITGSVRKICERFGRETGGRVHAFPQPLDVPSGSFYDKDLGLGYRSEYLELMFEYAREHEGFTEALKSLSPEGCKNALKAHKGIGEKVANCICLFGFHHTESFPVDTHVKQLLEKYYPNGLDLSPYKGFAGIIQQYLFYNEIHE